MRLIMCCLALFAALLGQAHAQTKGSALSPVQANWVVKDCSPRIAKEYPKFTIVGKFFKATYSALYTFNERLLDSNKTDEILSFGVATKNPNIFGATHRGYVGCSYYARNGTLSFRRMLGLNFFPKRYTLVPGET